MDITYLRVRKHFYCISIRIFRQNTDFIYEYFVEYKLHHATWCSFDVSQIRIDIASKNLKFVSL
jgi:hypothetical protein